MSGIGSLQGRFRSKQSPVVVVVVVVVEVVVVVVAVVVVVVIVVVEQPPAVCTATSHQTVKEGRTVPVLRDLY